MSESEKINFFYRKMNVTKSENHEWHVLMSFASNLTISQMIHAAYEFDIGDICPWPFDNLTPEEVIDLWASGQRSFVFKYGDDEIIWYDIRLMTDDEYHKFHDENKKKSDELKLMIYNVIYDELYDTVEREYIHSCSDKMLDMIASNSDKFFNWR